MVHIVKVTVTRPRGRPRLFRRILSLMAIIMLGLAGVLAFGLPRAFGQTADARAARAPVVIAIPDLPL